MVLGCSPLSPLSLSLYLFFFFFFLLLSGFFLPLVLLQISPAATDLSPGA